jgi:molybdate transport system substrate-binding protein
MRVFLAGLCLAAALWPAPARADDLTVAAASDLQYALREVAARFEQTTGHRVRLTFGSSGNFFAQIANGAPFDVFLSADTEYPRKLIEAGAADRSSFLVYGTGTIVLWVPPSSSAIDPNQGLRALLDPRVRRIALANPDHAPYGRAAVAALRHEGLYEMLSGKFVLGDNLTQAMQFVESGNADAGLVGLSLAIAPPLQGKGRYWIVPHAFYPPMEQGAVIVAHSTKKAAASAFLTFLRRPEIVELLARYGIEPAGGTR